LVKCCQNLGADAMAGLNDTHPEAEQVLREAYRKMSFDAKLRQMGTLYHTARLLHAAGVRYRYPNATEEMIQEEWRIISLGEELAHKVKEWRRGKQPGECRHRS
jgi:hypothetical protein